MSLNLKLPEIHELKPKITVFGCGGGGGNAVNNMINMGLEGVDFVVANTDAQDLLSSLANKRIQLGFRATEGLGAGSLPEIGKAAAEECIEEIRDYLDGSHMVFITAGMGGGTGTGAAPVIARVARELGILTVGVVTKPFQFEGAHRMRYAEHGIAELQREVDTLIVIPNQNLFRIINERTTVTDAFSMSDQVLNSGVACITNLILKEGLINLDFADVRVVMRDGGKAMMGTGEASGEGRALKAAEAAIANPLIDETCMKGAKSVLISVAGGHDLTLYEMDEAATRVRQEVDSEANIIVGTTIDPSLEGRIRVSIVATGIESLAAQAPVTRDSMMSDLMRNTSMLRDASMLRAPVAVKVEAPALQPVVEQQPVYSVVEEIVAAPVYDAPAPVYQAPAYQAPAYQAPAYQAPAYQAPAYQAPVAAAYQTPVAPYQAPAPYEAPAPAQQFVRQAPVQFVREEMVMRPLPSRPVVQEAPLAPSHEQVRMPVAAEFPRHVQEQIEERKPVSLLQRLTAGVTPRRDEHHIEAPRMQETRAQENRPAEPAPRQAPRQLVEEENYEIPAFLRRNAR